MLLQPKKAQLKCVENHCFIITVPAPLSFNEPLSKVTESTGLQLWRGGLVQIQSFATQPQFLSSSSNLQTSPINPSIPVLLFFVPSFFTLQLPSSKGWHPPCPCHSPKCWNLSVAFHSHEGITSGSSLVPSYNSLTA